MNKEKKVTLTNLYKSFNRGEIYTLSSKNKCPSCENMWGRHSGNECLHKENSVWPLFDIIKNIRLNGDGISISQITDLIKEREMA